MGRLGLRFAVSAPWCIELDQNVLLVVQDDVLVVVRHDDGDWAFLSLWDGLRLDAWLDFARQVLVDELADDLLGELVALVEREFLVLDSLLNGECRPLSNIEVQVLTVLTERFGIDSRQVDLALVFLCDGLEVFGELFTLFRSLGEDVAKG